MAIIVAVRSGNWSDTSHVTGPWPGGSTPTTKPGVGDTVQSGAFIVTIDEDVTVALIESTASGYFQITSAPELPARRTVTANTANSGAANGALKISNQTGAVDLIGDQTGGAGGNAWAIYNSGTIGDIIGDQTGGAGVNAWAIVNNGTIGGIDGDQTGGVGDFAYAIYNNGTIGDITGDQTGGAGEYAYAIYNHGTIGDIIGDQTGGAGGYAWAIYNIGGTIGDIIGDQTGGPGVSAWAINNNGGTIGGIDGSLICGPSGLFPIWGPFKLVANPANAIVVRKPDGDPWTLSNDYPAEADVRSGVEYNRGTQTGELAAGGNIGPVSIVIGGGGIRIS